MAENLSGGEQGRIHIEREVIDLNDGPFCIVLGDYVIGVVAPGRDLGEKWTKDCLVVDPDGIDPEHDVGFKGLGDGEELILGRDNDYGRFDFPDDVSRRHLMLTRDGSRITVEDLGSTNGTYLLVPPEHEAHGTSTAADLAGYSTPSDLHPKRNEDAYFVDSSKLALGVFDGIGSLEGSEYAARLAAELVENKLRKVNHRMPQPLGCMAMRIALLSAHEAILEEKPDAEIGTTATVAKLSEDNSGEPYLAVANVGDGRAYLLRGDGLDHLTLDYQSNGDRRGAMELQEKLANAVDLSQLEEWEQEAFHSRNQVESFLGDTLGSPIITTSGHAVRRGDRFLLTTDGVHDNLTTDEMAAATKKRGGPAEVARELVAKARSRSREGSHPRAKPDDITSAALFV